MKKKTSSNPNRALDILKMGRLKVFFFSIWTIYDLRSMISIKVYWLKSIT